MQERWGARLRDDPYYNINLSGIPHSIGSEGAPGRSPRTRGA